MHTVIDPSWIEDDEITEPTHVIPCDCGATYRALTPHGLVCMECGELTRLLELASLLDGLDETRH